MTFDECVDYWSRNRELEGEFSEDQVKRSKRKAKRFSKFIGKKQISKIKPADIIDAMNDIREEGKEHGSGRYSESTIRSYFIHARAAVEYCIQCERESGTNPFNKVKRPKAARHDAQYLSAADASKASKTAKREYLKSLSKNDLRMAGFWLAVCIALATGARRGEIFALEWQHVDLDEKRISIMQAIKAGTADVIGPPKSRSSVRQISIGTSLAGLLKKQRAALESAFADGRDMNGIRVLSDENGEQISMNSFEHWWRQIGAPKIGNPSLRFHELRHTHATLLISSGVDVKTVQTRLGHSDAEITLNVYAHAIPKNDAKAGSEIDKALFG